MLQSVTKKLIKVADEDVLAVFERYKSAYAFDQKFPGTEASKDLDTEHKLLQAGIEKLRTEAVRVLDEMEKPIPDLIVEPQSGYRLQKGPSKSITCGKSETGRVRVSPFTQTWLTDPTE